MQKVISYLQKDNLVLLFGGAGDNLDQLRVWENAYGNAIDMSRKYNLTEQIAIMYYLDIMISMDSANGHIAANCGIPVLTIWGCLLYTSPSPRDGLLSRMPSSA